MEGTLYGWGLLLALGLADYGEFSRALDEMYLQTPEDAFLNALENARNAKDATLKLLTLGEEADARATARMLFPRLEAEFRQKPLKTSVHYSNELERLMPSEMRFSDWFSGYVYAAEYAEWTPEDSVRANYEAAFARAKELGA